jgi:molybdenum cofactor synthesis domain-containing protein
MSKFSAAIVTVSDSSAAGKRRDLSGPAVADALKASFEIKSTEIVADEQAQIEAALRRLSRECDLVVTTGGTGVAERDVTPEATRIVCSRLIEGIPERMRAAGAEKTARAILSRGVCGVCGGAIILNLPGNPKAAVESLQAILEVLPHAIDLVRGKTQH